MSAPSSFASKLVSQAQDKIDHASEHVATIAQQAGPARRRKPVRYVRPIIILLSGVLVLARGLLGFAKYLAITLAGDKAIATIISAHERPGNKRSSYQLTLRWQAATGETREKAISVTSTLWDRVVSSVPTHYIGTPTTTGAAQPGIPTGSSVKQLTKTQLPLLYSPLFPVAGIMLEDESRYWVAPLMMTALGCFGLLMGAHLLRRAR